MIIKNIGRFISPLRYPGGKSKQAKKIVDYFPNKMELFQEVFVGGGSVFLTIAQEERANKIQINDHNEDLIEFWNDAKTSEHIEIYEEILKNRLEMNDDEFLGIYEQYKHLYLIKNKMSFNGLGTYSAQASRKNFGQSTIKRYKDLKELMVNVDVKCDTFENIIEADSQVNEEDIYMYLDPPYIGAKDLYKGHNEFDHNKLAKLLNNTKRKWVLSYDNDPRIRELYKDFIIEEMEWSYSMTNNRKEGGTKQGKELLIRNFTK